GIFRTPGLVAAQLGRPWLTFVAWVLGGALAFLGALCFAELATRHPRAGGKYVYVREAFGPRAGFVVGWVESVGMYTAAIAALGDLDVLRLPRRRQDRRGGGGPGAHAPPGVARWHCDRDRPVPALERRVPARAAARPDRRVEPGRRGRGHGDRGSARRRRHRR